MSSPKGSRAMPSARAASPTGLSRFASSCKHGIAIAAVLLAGCDYPPQPDTLRECKTNDGETFRYVQSGDWALAEDGLYHFRDTEGWSRDTGDVATCRTLRTLP